MIKTKLENKIKELEQQIEEIKNDCSEWYELLTKREKEGNLSMVNTINDILTRKYKEINHLEQIKDILSNILTGED